MSEISKLATAFEERSKERAETEEAVVSAFGAEPLTVGVERATDERTVAELRSGSRSGAGMASDSRVADVATERWGHWALGWHIKNQVDTIIQHAAISRFREGISI